MITLDFCPVAPCQGMDCPTYQAHIQREWTLSLGLNVEAGIPIDAQILKAVRRTLGNALASSHPTTSDGIAHRMPDDVAFYVHTLACIDGSTTYAAVYCGDEPVDELLERAPLYVEASA